MRNEIYNDEYTINKSYAEELKIKKNVFAEKTKTKKALFLTMITTYGLKENTYSNTLIQNSITMDALYDS